MSEEMKNRAPRSDPAPADGDTVVVRRSGADAVDLTVAAALAEETVRHDVLRDADAPVDDVDLLAGRYELGAILGRGATGVVYRGRDRVLRRDVAIKVLYGDLAGHEETSSRFEREAQLAARIQHPNAVAIFDTGVHDGQRFIVMECLPGGTLSTRIGQGGLPLDQVRTIGAQLLGALDAAHSSGVIHRDIKPANLLMTATGGVKVADFGIATDAERLALTNAGHVVGTLAYLAPERLQGAPATIRSDIYSAGVVLYEMLTGRKPFAGDTPAVLLDQISKGLTVDVAALGPEVDPGVAAVVMRALAKDPAARYPSAAAMAQALAYSGPSSARPPLPAFPPTSVLLPVVAAGSRNRRGRWIWGAVMAVVIVVLLIAALASRGDDFPRPTQSTGPAPTAPTTVVTTTVTTPTTRAVVTTSRATATTAKPKGKKD